MTERLCRLAITLGDSNGIGPEVVARALGSDQWPSNVSPILLGSADVFRFYTNKFGLRVPVEVVTTVEGEPTANTRIWQPSAAAAFSVEPGKLCGVSGAIAMESVAAAVDWCRTRKVDAMVTAPISKEAIGLAGYDAPGHTEFIADRLFTERHLMMLVSENLRVALATAHLPIRAVADHLGSVQVRQKLEILWVSLHSDFGIKQPKIAVLGLNPHAGDGGRIGTEEQDWIDSCIRSANADGLSCEGPFPADGFFGSRRYEEFDAVLAMYHDQGLVAFKTIAFNRGVNFTAGLPIVRTSPDHGTAFDIAGKGLANPGSFLDAVKTASELASRRFHGKVI